MEDAELDDGLGRLQVFLLILLAPMGFLAAIGALFSAFTDTDPIAVVIVCFIVLIVTIVLEVWLKLSDALLEKVTSR